MWELLLLVSPALEPHCSIERVALSQDLIGDGTDGPGIRLAVVDDNAAPWNRGSHLLGQRSHVIGDKAVRIYEQMRSIRANSVHLRGHKRGVSSSADPHAVVG